MQPEKIFGTIVHYLVYYLVCNKTSINAWENKVGDRQNYERTQPQVAVGSVLFTLKKPTESMLKPNGFKREFLNRFQDEKIMAVLFFTILVLRISLRCLSFIRSMTHLLHCMAIGMGCPVQKGGIQNQIDFKIQSVSKIEVVKKVNTKECAAFERFR